MRLVDASDLIVLRIFAQKVMLATQREEINFSKIMVAIQKY